MSLIVPCQWCICLLGYSNPRWHMIGPEASGCPCWLSLFYSLSLFSPDLPSVGDSLEACNLDLCKMMKGQRGGTLACRNLGKYAAAKSLQSCATLCDPIGGSPPGSAVPGILQARTLEWVAVSFSNSWKWKVKVKPLSPARLLATPWTAAYQAPPSMGFSRQEYWSGV